MGWVGGNQLEKTQRDVLCLNAGAGSQGDCRYPHPFANLLNHAYSFEKIRFNKNGLHQ